MYQGSRTLRKNKGTGEQDSLSKMHGLGWS